MSTPNRLHGPSERSDAAEARKVSYPHAVRPSQGVDRASLDWNDLLWENDGWHCRDEDDPPALLAVYRCPNDGNRLRSNGCGLGCPLCTYRTDHWGRVA